MKLWQWLAAGWVVVGCVAARAIVAAAGGATVTDTHIITHHETVPRFAAPPDRIAVQDGDWSNPATWGGVPIETDNKVLIPAGVAVTYDQETGAPVDDVEIGGRLSMATDHPVRYCFRTLTIMPGGEVEIGTAANPATAELIVRDKPIDHGEDPEEHGGGIINYGKLTGHGRIVVPWLRLNYAPAAGDNSITTDPTWAASDTVIIPHTRQRIVGRRIPWASETEERTLTGDCGATHDLSAPLEFDHGGAAANPWGVELFPHVFNVTRSICIRSENPAGTRGHIITMADGFTNLSFATFRDLGRTRGDVPLGAGNQVGRYSTHEHHAAQAGRYHGCVWHGALKWAATFHDTTGGRVTDGIVYDAQGAGIACELGTETDCVFDGVAVVKVAGGFQAGDKRGGITRNSNGEGEDTGADSSGFWFRGTTGTVRNCIVYDVAGSAYNFNRYTFGRDPIFRQPVTFDDPAAGFVGNEAAACRVGLWLTWSQAFNNIGGFQRQAFRGFTAWHCHEAGIEAYHEAANTFADCLIISDAQAASQNEGSASRIDSYVTQGVKLGVKTYQNFETIITDARVSGANLAITAPVNAGQFFHIEGADTSGYVGLGFINGADPNAAELIGYFYLGDGGVGRVSDAQPSNPQGIYTDGI